MNVPVGPGCSHIEAVAGRIVVGDDRSCHNEEEEFSNSHSTCSRSEAEGRRKNCTSEAGIEAAGCSSLGSTF